MSSAYWNQWTRAELLSLQGVELDAYRNDRHHEPITMIGSEDKEDSEDENNAYPNDGSCCCMNCMECLGLSWADFM